MIYQMGLPYALYLTIPEDIFEDIFDPVIMKVVNDSQIKITVINLETEEFVKWIE